MGSIGKRQQSHFTDRIRRIEAGGPNTAGTIYAGIDEAQHRRRKRKRWNTTGPSFASQLFLIPFAILIGAGSMLTGRIAAFHAMAEPELIPEEYIGLFALTADIGIAVLLGGFAAFIFSLNQGARLVAFMVGFIGIMLGEALLISNAPDAFVAMFSDDYVQTAIASVPADPFSPEALGL